MGMGIPELIKRIAEGKPGAAATGPAARLATLPSHQPYCHPAAAAANEHR